MLKILAIFTLFGAVLFGRPCVAENQQGHSHAQENNANQSQKALPPPPDSVVVYSENCCNPQATEAKKAAEEKPLPRFLGPEWIVVYITAVYVFISAWMLIAMKRQTRHLVISERAWFTCKAEISSELEHPNQVNTKVAFIFLNTGKTPGFITEIGFAIDALKEGESLPLIPSGYESKDLAKWGGRGIPIAPQDSMSRFGSIEVSNPAVEQLKTGELVLWVHGYVKYRDTFVQSEHETRYCLKWEPGRAGSGSVEFSIAGPEAYNSAT
jgi:hypothetical protein